jgi:hypothetical protein
MLAPMLVRATGTISTLPYWEMDPMTVVAPMASVTPALSILLDAFTLLGVAVGVFAGRNIPAARWWWPAVALVALGALPLAYHGWLGPTGSIHQVRIGASWLAAIAAAVTLARLARDRRVRTLALAALLGAAVLLVAKGAAQVLVEQPRDAANFRLNRDLILRSYGWSADSSMAKSFERRLLQTEATGWFGLSNVYASLCVGLGAGLLGLAAAAWRQRRTPAAVLGVAGLGAFAGVAMAGSKGGTAALGIALISAAALLWLQRRAEAHGRAASTLAALLGPMGIAAAIGAVVVRGLIGERIGELSILFRWFYMQAAVKIGAEHPFAGVGPEGFKDAYLLAKNPLSPEEVSSPHILLLDWWACLGAPGLLWGCVLLLLAGAAGLGVLRELGSAQGAARMEPASAAPSPPASDDEAHLLSRVALIIPVVVTFAGLIIQRAELLPIEAAVRVGGLVGWAIVAVAVVRVSCGGGSGTDAAASPWARAGLAGGAVALCAHAQIELTGSWVQSVGLFMAFLGLAAAGSTIAPGTPHTAHTAPARARFTRALPAITGLGTLATCAWLLVLGVLPARVWERELRAAAAALEPVADARTTLSALNRLPPPEASRELSRVVASLSSALGRPVNPDPPSINAALRAISVERAALAYRRLPLLPRTDPRPFREHFRIRALLAENHHPVLGEPFVIGGGALPTGTAPQRINWSRIWPHGFPPGATTALVGEAQYLRAFGESSHTPPDKAILALILSAAAMDDILRERDPWNLTLTLDVIDTRKALLARLAPDAPERAAVEPAIRASAKRALELDALARLDREVRGLTDAQRAMLRPLAGTP